MLSLILFFRFWSETPKERIENMIRDEKFNEAFEELTNLMNSSEDELDPIFLELRAQCSIMISMARTAINDINKLLSIRNIATIERMHLISLRAAANLKIGDYQNALEDSKYSSNKRIKQLCEEAARILESDEINYANINRLLSISPESPDALSKACKFFLNNNDYENFAKYSQALLQYDPNNNEVLKQRGEVFLCSANFNESIEELTTCDDCQEIQHNALYLSNFVGTVLHKNINQILKTIDRARLIVDSTCTRSSLLAAFIKLVNSSLLRSQKKLDLAYEIVEDVLKQYPKYNDALLIKADILLDAGDYESAVKIYKQLIESDPGNIQVQQRYEKGIQLIQKENNISLFTIIGVPENSKPEVVISGFRRAVLRWHPDNFKNKLSKKIAEKKMKKVNAAFELLKFKFNNPRINNIEK